MEGTGDAASDAYAAAPQPVGYATTAVTALLAVSDDGSLVSRDELFCALFGMPTAILASGTLSSIIQWLRASSREVCTALADLLLSEVTARGQAQRGELQSPCGRVIEWTATPLAYGVLRGRAWTFREVSAARAAMRALRDAESWLRLFSAHHDGVMLEVDGSARVVGLWAAEANAFFGVPEVGLRGRTVIDILGPTHGAELDAHIRGVLATGRPSSFQMSYDVGASRVFAVNAVLLSSGERQEPSVTVLIRDITQQSRLEGQLRRAERLVSVGLLAAGVAHEINNPLGYMLLNLQRVRRGLDEIRADVPVGVHARTLAELGHSLEMTVEGTLRVQDIVRDLMHFARSGSDEPRGPVDVQRVLASTLDMAIRDLEQRARIVREFAPVPPITATEGRLAQVFLNLMLNAAQAIPEGNPEDNVIRVRTETDDDGRAIIEVHDTGVGIPEHVVRHIFDPFFTTKASGAGTGLGLAICHGITTGLGGSISVESREGRGSVFRVSFPRSDLAGDGSG